MTASDAGIHDMKLYISVTASEFHMKCTFGAVVVPTLSAVLFVVTVFFAPKLFIFSFSFVLCLNFLSTNFFKLVFHS